MAKADETVYLNSSWRLQLCWEFIEQTYCFSSYTEFPKVGLFSKIAYKEELFSSQENIQYLIE